ncbi:hypothetical protein C8J56DRAFT_868550 [Mycena floridula]|nr:hypothetical protein C8J56DRAFT_868550 [Mycena floridula]
MRARDPQRTDIAEKLIALRRQTATKPPKNSQPEPQPAARKSSATAETDPDDFSRRLNISNSPRQTKLFNPERDPIPTIRRTTEPEIMSDAASSAYARSREQSSPRHLFDHRKDDPVRFSVLTRPSRPTPTPKSSGDHMSSSASSYAASQTSSSFTLSSTTDGSSASSALFDNQGKPTEDPGTSNIFALQLKKLYRTITSLEAKIKLEDVEENDLINEGGGRIMLKGKEVEDEETEKERWKAQIADHKKLIDTIHNLLELSLAPTVPASLRNIPTKYNIVARLWTNGFFKLLESLRRAAFSLPASSSAAISSSTSFPSNPQPSYASGHRGSQFALEHLTDFTYYAYTFYTGLLEEPQLVSFRSGWLEALGDMARYKMMVETFLERREKETSSLTRSNGGLTMKNLSDAVEGMVMDPPLSIGLAPPDISRDATRHNSNSQAKSTSKSPLSVVDSDANHSHAAPSVGVHAAQLLQAYMEPEKERWRNIARDWYGMGLGEQPGTGKLHHHIGVLCREVIVGGKVAERDEKEMLRGVYHYVKSMTTLHPFPTSRESILAFFSPSLQQKPTTKSIPSLFVQLHGMLFTNINLDAFDETMARFMTSIKTSVDGQIEDREWIMMATINLGAVLEYGKAGGVVRKCMGGTAGPSNSTSSSGPSRVGKREREVDTYDGDRMDVDETRSARASPMPANAVPASEPLPQAVIHALNLTFTLLSHVLQNPFRRSTPYSSRSVNPYLTVLLTFLPTVLKSSGVAGSDGRKHSVLELIERWVPWHDLAEFLSTKIPGGIWESQNLIPTSSTPFKSRPVEDRWPMLTTGTAPPLPEDWCLRGTEWVGRKVYERGFWKGNGGDDEKFARPEIEYLSESEVGKGDDGTDGKIEDDDDEDSHGPGSRYRGIPMVWKSNTDASLMPPPRRSNTPSDVNKKRFVRLLRCGVTLATLVDGFGWNEGTRRFSVHGILEQKIQHWQEEERVRQAEEESRRQRLSERWQDMPSDMDVDYEEAMSSEESSDDEDDSEQVKVLKARRRYLKSLLRTAHHHQPRAPSPARRHRARGSRHGSKAPAQNLSFRPGYTVLVLDTNILLSSLSDVAKLIESYRWTVLIPVPVLMELEGLSLNPSQLGDAAKEALTFIGLRMKTHGRSLKVQTTKGNYLNNLAVVAEEVSFSASDERNMDDLILKIALWHQDHWSDRSDMLPDNDSMDVEEPMNVEAPIKVLLLSLDRNLRLKARSRQLPAADERDLASILASTVT